MTNEKNFQKNITRAFKEAGLFSLNLDPLTKFFPGLPDMLVGKQNKFIFIENKKLEVVQEDKKKIKPLFKKTQPAAYLKMLKYNIPIFLFIRVKDKGVLGYVLAKITYGFVMNLDRLTYSDLPDNTTVFRFSTNLRDIMEVIKEEING